LKVKPIDILRSDWECTIEQHDESIILRIGFGYVRGLREAAAQAIVAARHIVSFEHISDLTRRVPELRKDELQNLAACGALNPLDRKSQLHRRVLCGKSQNSAVPSGHCYERSQTTIPRQFFCA
jgi:error-prone DNA polymerase